jgi:hypothetical protein
MIEEERKKSVEEATSAIMEENRHLGILIEDTNSKYATVIEGLGALEKQIGEVDHKIDGFEIRLGRRIDNLDDKLEGFKQETRENFQMFFERLSAYDDDKADKKDVAVLERRVTRLEEKI